MLSKRIIPCLDVDHGRTVKGVNFQGLRDVGDPVALALAARSRGTAMAILAATVIRFLTALLLLAPLALSGWFDRTVLVVCVGVSYVLMLLVDTLYSIRMMRRLFENE